MTRKVDLAYHALLSFLFDLWQQTGDGRVLKLLLEAMKSCSIGAPTAIEYALSEHTDLSRAYVEYWRLCGPSGKLTDGGAQ